MKAINIIDAMTYDSGLAESSTVWKFSVDDEVAPWIRRLFGSFHLKEGSIDPGYYYLTIWQGDAEGLIFTASNPPDVTLTRDDPSESDEDDQEIYLWRIEG